MGVRPLGNKRAATVILSACILCGCATVPDDEPVYRRSGDPASRLQRENMLQAAWRGRTYQALLEKFGSPRMVMSVPGYRPVRTEIVVYGTRDRLTNCIDAFTVITNSNNGEVTIADYFCR